MPYDNYPGVDEFNNFPPEVRAAIAASTELATYFNNRQIYGYRWANAAARTAQTGMRQGDTGIQLDTNYKYVYTGSVWMLSHGDIAPSSYGTNVTSAAGDVSTYIHKEGRTATANLFLNVGSQINQDATLLVLPPEVVGVASEYTAGTAIIRNAGLGNVLGVGQITVRGNVLGFFQWLYGTNVNANLVNQSIAGQISWRTAQ